MRLENDYYTWTGQEPTYMEGVFRLRLQKDCPVYQGHFPGNPVAPGVCNMQVIRECAEQLAGCKLYVRHLKKCRLITVLKPDNQSELTVSVRLSPTSTGYLCRAEMRDSDCIYVIYQGELSREER
ncbi:MAG: beta-hydroxyacyl-ACP dehydratase [Parabacteroides sp.]